MNQEITICHIVLGEALTIRATLLDNGVNVLVTGGSLTHVGSVSVAQPVEKGINPQSEKNLQTIVLPGHHDNKISDRFACVLAQTLNCTAVVECGVHYDNLSRSGIEAVLSASEELLEELITALRERFHKVGES